jgi:hypothetical protein
VHASISRSWSLNSQLIMQRIGMPVPKAIAMAARRFRGYWMRSIR